MNLEELNLEKNLNETIEKYQEQLRALRTNRASVSLVEKMPVDYFGAKTPLKHIASISLSDPKTIVIAPWNKDNLVDIEKAINESNLNLTPNNDGEIIRLTLPQLTEERRQELVKLLGKISEEARIKIRKVREKAINEIEEKEKRGEISEDDKFRAKDEIQKEIDKANERIDEIYNKKEKAIIEV